MALKILETTIVMLASPNHGRNQSLQLLRSRRGLVAHHPFTDGEGRNAAELTGIHHVGQLFVVFLPGQLKQSDDISIDLPTKKSEEHFVRKNNANPKKKTKTLVRKINANQLVADVLQICIDFPNKIIFYYFLR